MKKSHIVIKERKDCCGCGACEAICPSTPKSISLELDNEGYYPKVNESTCTLCNLCVTVCPLTSQPDPGKNLAKPTAYAAWNRDPVIRENSSSGGIFSALAHHIIAAGGVVFGAAFTDDFQSVKHIAVESIGDLPRLRGSKYVQSSTSEALPLVKQYLATGRKVLFVGAPCQVAGVKNLMRSKKYKENLVTCDFVCHGVPSPLIFKKYIAEQEKKYNAKTTAYNFRHKRHGWNFIDVHQEFSNARTYHKWNWGDSFMYAFYKNITLQPACYDCSFNRFPRAADITLADFWGVAKKYPEYDDNKGTSLIVTNTENGHNLFHSCRKQLFIGECDFEYSVAHNLHFTDSAVPHPQRALFFSKISDKPFADVMRQFMTVETRAKRKLARFVKNILWKWRKLKRMT
jgi:coenzyme F420-reducing hydrogenase beta subunit